MLLSAFPVWRSSGIISENSLFRANQYFNNIKRKKLFSFPPKMLNSNASYDHAQRSSKRCRAHYCMQRKSVHAAEGQSQRNI